MCRGSGGRDGGRPTASDPGETEAQRYEQQRSMPAYVSKARHVVARIAPLCVQKPRPARACAEARPKWRPRSRLQEWVAPESDVFAAVELTGETVELEEPLPDVDGGGVADVPGFSTRSCGPQGTPNVYVL